MPPMPVQSWCGCCVLVVPSVGIPGPWRGRPHRLQVRSVDTQEGPRSLTVSLSWTHMPAGMYTNVGTHTRTHIWQNQWQTDTRRVKNKTGASREPLNIHPSLESSFNLFLCSLLGPFKLPFLSVQLKLPKKRCWNDKDCQLQTRGGGEVETAVVVYGLDSYWICRAVRPPSITLMILRVSCMKQRVLVVSSRWQTHTFLFTQRTVGLLKKWTDSEVRATSSITGWKYFIPLLVVMENAGDLF